MSSTSAAIPDISTINIGSTYLSGFRSHQDQYGIHASTRGSINAVRRIPDETVVVPCSPTLVSVSGDIASEDANECCE